MKQFQTEIEGLSWDKGSAAASINKLFSAVDQLADAEVRYYFRRRRTRAWISGITRFGAWIFGSIGLLLPLIEAANESNYSSFSDYGYVFLAVAASCLAANSLFGGTEGHIRFCTTQLTLEKLITKNRIKWTSFLANQDPSTLKNGFSLITAYAEELHTTTLSETNQWGESLLRELAKYQSQVNSKSSSSS